MNPTQVKQYFDSFINYEHKRGPLPRTPFKLDRVRQLFSRLNNPQNNLKIIHIAGSKGKGSVAAMTAAVLKEAGYSVGLYTSPHLNSYRERIRILSKNKTGAPQNGDDIFPDMISEQELCDLADEIKPVADQMRNDPHVGTITFFELFTALAACYFYKACVDFVVLETGLGGRLDATNVMESMTAVITPISLEHTRILGNTLEEIAGEKVAIIKRRGQKAVIAPQKKEVDEAVKAHCRQLDIKPVWVADSYQFGNMHMDAENQIFDLATPKSNFARLKLQLVGSHQRENAATVIGVVECLQELGYRIPADAAYKGLGGVFWPGRFEIIQREPLVILDCAHDGASARALAVTMTRLYNDKNVIIILGLSEDKNADEICHALEKITKDIIYAKAKHPRARDFDGSTDVESALNLAHLRANKNDVILVTGSIFLVAEARKIMLDKNHKSQTADHKQYQNI